jgi:hypothetical protein
VDALQIGGVGVILGVGLGDTGGGVGGGIGVSKQVIQSPKSGVPKSGPPGPPN